MKEIITHTHTHFKSHIKCGGGGGEENKIQSNVKYSFEHVLFFNVIDVRLQIFYFFYFSLIIQVFYLN